jgi:hypothetical protein
VVSPDIYRELLNEFSATVKSVDPSNVVLAAGLAPIAVPGATVAPLRFARQLLCMKGNTHPRPLPGSCGGGVNFDIFDIHPYSTGGPTHKGKADDAQLGNLKRLTALLAAADRAHRIKGRFHHTPIWATEVAWDSNPPDPGGLRPKILSRWTAEALYRLWLAKIDHVFWYQVRDPAPNLSRAPSESFETGLYFRGATPAEDQPKPNLEAFRFPFVAYSRESGFYFWGRTPTSRGGKVSIQILKGGRWRNAALIKADKRGMFEGIVKGAYGRHKHGTVRARYRGETAIPFSLHPVKDFYHPPFG